MEHCPEHAFVQDDPVGSLGDPPLACDLYQLERECRGAAQSRLVAARRIDAGDGSEDDFHGVVDRWLRNDFAGGHDRHTG